MIDDELFRDAMAGITAYRFRCHRCGYLTQQLGRRHAELVQRVHRHRHVVGLAGIYHPEGI